MKPIRYAIFQTIAWTATVSLSLGLFYANTQKQSWELAKKEAMTILNKDMAFRDWAARHGGVYVPPTAETPPNPYLINISDRDVTASSGKQLTLMNPAYMLRQIQEYFAAAYKIRGHVTSLKLFNPHNQADAWETAALHRLGQGEQEVSEQEKVDGSPYVRLMLPMITKKGCLKCHGDQGYEEGDVRGGVSVAVPVEPYLELTRQSLLTAIAMHGVIWSLGMMGISILTLAQRRWMQEREASSERLSLALVEMEGKVDERTEELAAANQALKEDIEEKKRKQTMLQAANMELERVNLEIKNAQSQLLQREKMASIGQLAAGIAHEINNPVGFIHSNLSTLAKYLERFTEYMAAQQAACADLAEEQQHSLSVKAKTLKIDYVTADAKELIRECLEGTDRVKEITMNLKNFSRVDHQEQQAANLNTCLEETLRIVWNELKYKATVIKEYGELPKTVCYPQQLNQVFVNLLVNASQALIDKGEIRIRTWIAESSIFIAISDNGPGIPEEIRHRLFEPFFTTKEVGKGTGLGLSISYDIVKKHGGEITIDSEEGRGTTFTVQIPVRERDGASG